MAAAWGTVSRAAAGAGKVSEAKLTAIVSRVNARSASLVIEASEPVPYVATRPDALTIVLDLRNVAASSLAAIPKPDPQGPIAGVAVEAAESLGTPVSRIRISLSRPVAHHVRSAKNTVVVDFEPGSSKSAPFVMPPASRQAEQNSASINTPAVDPIAALGLAQAEPSAGVPPLPVGLARPVVGSAAMLAPPPATAQEQPGISRGGRAYTGTPVSMDFQQADLRAVLRVFSEVSGLNIVIDPAVNGTVDVALKDVPWDQALDIILRANKLGYLVDGTIVRIAPLTVLADEESQRRKLADEQSLSGELRVLTKTLSYARAEELQPLITKSALSQRGTVVVDARTNTVIITDLAERLATAESLIAALDRAQPQVEIEARIVQTSKNFSRQLGVNWGFNGRVDPSLGNTTNMAFPNNGRLGGALGPSTGGQPGAVGLGVGAATSAVGLALGSVNGAFNLDVALSALEQSGNGRILSTPRVSTLNNVEAEMTQGVQIPLQTIANNTVTVTFRDAALTLKVTPQITAVGTVIMKVSLENSSPDFSKAAGPSAIPPINTQRALTTLLVNDGQTTVIGGIYMSDQNNTTDRTPGLGQVPILNWLFKRELVRDESKELLIFITPRIIKG
jgi:type IV pilus assembly protein PilQ